MFLTITFSNRNYIKLFQGNQELLQDYSRKLFQEIFDHFYYEIFMKFRKYRNIILYFDLDITGMLWTYF